MDLGPDYFRLAVSVMASRVSNADVIHNCTEMASLDPLRNIAERTVSANPASRRAPFIAGPSAASRRAGAPDEGAYGAIVPR